MIFFSFFKTLINKQVTIELKNDIAIKGTLKSIDQYLNVKLDDVTVTDEIKYPHLSSVKNVFIRGSTVRYVHLDPLTVDVNLLEDATRQSLQDEAATKAKLKEALEQEADQKQEAAQSVREGAPTPDALPVSKEDALQAPAAPVTRKRTVREFET